MMKFQRMIRLAACLGLSVLSVACGDDESKDSKYPGELGAFCESKADCDGQGAFCIRDISEDENDLAYCTKDCEQDADCGDQGACIDSGIEGHEKLCARRCEDAAFCEDLSTEYNACQVWPDTNPARICGFRG